MSLVEKVKSHIRDVADFPKPGIVFKDITPIFANPQLVHEIVGELVNIVQPLRPDGIAAVEARGFIFGAMLAHELKCRFIPIRKSGKLPYKTRRKEYALEYGSAIVEVHEDAISRGDRVLVHDDLLATGGTATAAGDLVREMDGELIGFSFIVNLGFLPGAEKISKKFGINPNFLVRY